MSLAVDALGITKEGEFYVHVFVERGDVGRLLSLGAFYATSMFFGGLGVFQSNRDAKGVKVDNEADSTLVNNTELTRTITVPTNSLWELEYGSVLNADDVTRVVNYEWDDGADGLGGWTPGQSATGLSLGAGRRDNFPLTVGSGGSATLPGVRQSPLSAGDRILITWFAGGASAGGTAKSSAVVRELLEEQ